MTYLEAYNQYISTTENRCDTIENILAITLQKVNLKHHTNYTYCSFLETTRIKVINTFLSTSKIYEICKLGLEENNIKNCNLKVLKTESRSKMEFIISVSFNDNE